MRHSSGTGLLSRSNSAASSTSSVVAKTRAASRSSSCSEVIAKEGRKDDIVLRKVTVEGRLVRWLRQACFRVHAAFTRLRLTFIRQRRPRVFGSTERQPQRAPAAAVAALDLSAVGGRHSTSYQRPQRRHTPAHTHKLGKRCPVPRALFTC